MGSLLAVTEVAACVCLQLMSHRVVWVGNFAYDVTEQQCIEFFSVCGEVRSFRVVTDRETQQSTGYGFREFKDPDAAATAIRNLNNTQFRGRTLRVSLPQSESDTVRGGSAPGARGACIRM